MTTNSPSTSTRVDQSRMLTARAIRAWLDCGDLLDRYMNDAEFHAAVHVTRGILEKVTAAMLGLFPLAEQLIDDLLAETLVTMRLEDTGRVRDLAQLACAPGLPTTPEFRIGADPRLHALRRKCGGRNCHADIFMAATPRSLMPLNFDPVPVHRGTVMLSWPDDPHPNAMVYPAAVVVDDVDLRVIDHPGQLWYRPHWADCPNADQFRTKKIFGGGR